MATVTASAMNRIEKAHQMYRDGKHREALDLYTEALAMAKTKAQEIALHSNRAACYLKLQDFKKAAEECTSVLELDYQHTGALMLRAQTLVTLKDYQSALFDVSRLMELNPSSDVYRDLQARLKTQLALAPIPESEEETVNIEGGAGEEKEEDRERLERREQMQEDNSAPKEGNKTIEPPSINHTKSTMAQNQNQNEKVESPSDVHSRGWEAIPKPKGHSRLDYSQWDRVDDDSSEDDDDDEDEQQQPQYRFRVRTVGVRPVK